MEGIAEKIMGVLPAKAKRQALLLVCMLSGFIFLVMLLVYSYHLGIEMSLGAFGIFAMYHVEFMIAIATLGIAVGAGTFYLLGGLIEKRQEEAKWGASMLLKFLSGDERSVVELMLRKRGSVYQSEIAALEGVGRVRAHRVVGKLAKRGVISVRKAGKINVLELAPELLHGLGQ
ncbi:hypothetical protein J4441_04290 [Candidatus Micrarchaeota archaeon]|nr:hypothetical protein [Candidatus Micrarchaeota archaeon]